MFILVDANNTNQPLDLAGVLKNFRNVKDVEASAPAQNEGEDLEFKDALDAYRQAKESPMKKVFTAEDIMSSPVTTISSKTSLQEVLNLFADKRFRHIPIVHGDKLMNLISDRDVFQIQIEQSQKVDPFFDHPILSYVKPREILCARETTAIPKIALLMLQKNIGCLPVLDDNDAIVGLVTRSDILRAMVQFGPIDLWL